MQRAVLDASARASWRAIPDGRRLNRDRLDRADWVSGHHSGVGTRIGISGRAGFAEGREARSKREDLFGTVPLCAPTGQASWEEAGVKTVRSIYQSFPIRAQRRLEAVKQTGGLLFGDGGGNHEKTLLPGSRVCKLENKIL